jgi:ParB family transcriptional regulator, chromosome partitioning protein
LISCKETPRPASAWRNATPSWSHHASSADYLRWLAANDYPLAAVEEVITEAKDAESVYAQYLADAVKE